MGTQQVRPRVVAGVDGSESALEAVRWAARDALRRGLPLRLVNAFAWPAEKGQGGHRHGAAYREAMLEVARGRLATAAAAAEQAAPGVEVQQQLEVGAPIPVLGSESRRAALLVIGDRGLGGVSGLLVGSVAVALSAGGDCPVVVVRGAPGEWAGDPLRPVVVGVDAAPTSEAAIAFAYDAAAARRVPLVAVHTWWDYMIDPMTAPMLDWAAIETEERQNLAERLAGWAEKYPDVQVQRLVARDRPAHALLEQAARAQLVVVGSRGRGGLSGLVLGSVSHTLLHRAPCPVAVVRPESTPAG